jgi:hypothetical protein
MYICSTCARLPGDIGSSSSDDVVADGALPSSSVSAEPPLATGGTAVARPRCPAARTKERCQEDVRASNSTCCNQSLYPALLLSAAHAATRYYTAAPSCLVLTPSIHVILKQTKASCRMLLSVVPPSAEEDTKLAMLPGRLGWMPAAVKGGARAAAAEGCSCISSRSRVASRCMSTTCCAADALICASNMACSSGTAHQ